MKIIDSRPETYKHIHFVQNNMSVAIKNLMDRSANHDQSKLESPEVEYFDEWTPRLREMEFGSEEYKKSLEALAPALDHHYSMNDHHPQHYPNGLAGMSLMALTEMLCDWYAAGKRNKNGCIMKSIELNQTRFGYSDDVKQILLNTAYELGFIEKEAA